MNGRLDQYLRLVSVVLIVPQVGIVHVPIIISILRTDDGERPRRGRMKSAFVNSSSTQLHVADAPCFDESDWNEAAPGPAIACGDLPFHCSGPSFRTDVTTDCERSLHCRRRRICAGGGRRTGPQIVRRREFLCRMWRLFGMQWRRRADPRTFRMLPGGNVRLRILRRAGVLRWG